MRLYGRRFADRAMKRRAEARVESRDAVLWDVDAVSQTCRVKIQGSSEFIVAHFPRNWKQAPYWLKPGNAVHILHRSGNRGYVEVIGEGRAIPSPVAGSALPEQPGLTDAIIWGCEVSAFGGMYLTVTSGSYRISGQVYAFSPAEADYLVMDDDEEIMGPMDVNPRVMDLADYTVELDASPAEGQARYDLLVLGTDGELDYIAGTASGNPIKPSVPGSHLQIGGYVLVLGGRTDITDADIGAEWKARQASALDVSAAAEFAWDAGDDYPETDIAVTVKDQYGWTLPGSWSLTLQKIYGSGQIWSTGDGWQNDEVSATGSTGYTFKYRRDQTGTEHSCVFLITLNQTVPLQGTHVMALLDSGGNPIA